MKKNGGKQAKRPAPGAPLPETSPDLEALKKMVRLLERKHREFLEKDWKEHAYEIQRSQFNQLMTVRFAMPCNLGRIMAVTGLTSAGASLPDTSPDLESFKKMVRLLERKHREFLEQDWKEHAYEIQRSQFTSS